MGSRQRVVIARVLGRTRPINWMLSLFTGSGV
jgi:ABC-type thiamine transport system ATPase subunit